MVEVWLNKNESSSLQNDVQLYHKISTDHEEQLHHKVVVQNITVDQHKSQIYLEQWLLLAEILFHRYLHKSN